MFVTVQLPIADLRCFLPGGGSGMLPLISAFPALDTDGDFVRSFGPLRDRRRGGLDSWPGEGVYAGADRAVRFPEGFGTRTMGSRWAGPGWRVACRRLLHDGVAVSRVEIGLAADEEGWMQTHSTDDLLRAALEIPVHIDGARHADRLGSLGTALAAHYRRCTTAVKHTGPSSAWWCAAGPAAVVVEAETVPETATAPAVVTNLDWGSHASSWRVEHDGRTVRAWSLRLPSGYGFSWMRGHHRYRRRLRMHLLRLNAEWHALRVVLRELGRERIAVDPGSAATERLQAFLNRATHLLRKRRLDGMPQGELLKAAYDLDDLVNEGQRTTLLRVIDDLRPNLARKVRDVVDPEGRDQVTRILVLQAGAEGGTPLRVDREMRAVDQALWKSTHGRSFDLRTFQAVRIEDLQQLLRRIRPHVVHFSGHGDPQGRLVMEDGGGRPVEISPDAIGDLLAVHGSGVRCVVLNACSSAPTARAAAAHVDVVIGTTREVGDRAAILFAETFYEALGWGDDVAGAYRAARTRLATESITDVTEMYVNPGADAAGIRFVTPAAAP